MYNKSLLRNFIKSKLSNFKIRRMQSVLCIWVSAFIVNKKTNFVFSLPSSIYT